MYDLSQLTNAFIGIYYIYKLLAVSEVSTKILANYPAFELYLKNTLLGVFAFLES